MKGDGDCMSLIAFAKFLNTAVRDTVLDLLLIHQAQNLLVQKKAGTVPEQAFFSKNDLETARKDHNSIVRTEQGNCVSA